MVTCGDAGYDAFVVSVEHSLEEIELCKIYKYHLFETSFFTLKELRLCHLTKII